MKYYIRIKQNGLIQMVSINYYENTIEILNAPEDLLTYPSKYKYVNNELIEIPIEEQTVCPCCGKSYDLQLSENIEN